MDRASCIAIAIAIAIAFVSLFSPGLRFIDYFETEPDNGFGQRRYNGFALRAWTSAWRRPGIGRRRIGKLQLGIEASTRFISHH